MTKKYNFWQLAIGGVLFLMAAPAMGQAEGESAVDANQSAARDTLCAILHAQNDYYADYGYYAWHLDELSEADPPYLIWEGPSGNQGYDFAMRSDRGRYSITADPVEEGITGIEHYFADYAWELHYALGGAAGWYSPLYPDTFCAAAMDVESNEASTLANLCTLQQALAFWRGATGTFPASLSEMTAPLTALFCDWSQPRYGYTFVFSSTADTYVLNADPVLFGVSGNRGFFLDESGVIREEWGSSASILSDPASEPCGEPNECFATALRNDAAVIENLCVVHHAQLRHYRHYGEYASSFEELSCYLEGDWMRVVNGYNFTLAGVMNGYRSNADPVDMNATGIRGFCLDQTGVIRFAMGAAADEESTALEEACPGLSEGELEGEDLTVHSADQDADYRISLSELLRVVQFYNSSGYHCASGTEDGYAPGSGDHGCSAHSSDYNGQDWVISLSELLRAAQFFGYLDCGYHACAGSEDGFCAGPF